LVDARSEVQRSLDAQGTISDFGWSPDGRSLAVASYEPGQPVAAFEILPVDAPGERRSVPFVPATDNSGAATVNPLLIAGWQPDASAVLVWIQEGGSGSIMQDGLELWLVPLDGREPHHLGTTLVKPEWIRWSPDGTRVAIVHSAGRMVIGSPRVVTVCTTDGTCTPIAPGDDRTVDPAWSPDGQTIAFVRQPAEGQPIVRRGVPDWRALYNSRQMWVANADGSDAHQVAAAGGGVAAPSWSPDGRRILYVRNDALWDLDLNVDHATRLIGPIAPVPVVTNGFQSNLAAPDAPYEPTRANGFSGWATLVSWHPR
jgi:Tol biopolymer transport system component